MEIAGKIKMISDIQTFDSGFRKRNVVVTTEEQYPQHILVEFTQDRCEILNSYKVGDGVKVSINLRGREWVNPQGETVYFNSIQGWRIERLQAESAMNQSVNPNAESVIPQQVPNIQTPESSEEDDDLPF